MRKILAFFAPALLALYCLAAPATAAPPAPVGTSVLAGYTPLSVTSASARVALPADISLYVAVTIYNSGSTDAFFALGSSSVTATTSSTSLPAGTYLTVWVGTNTYVAAITASSTTTLKLYQANGPVQFGQVPAPPTGGTVTSVGLTAPSIFTVSGSPVTGAGTLDFALNTQTANTVLVGPSSGGAATPTFRALVAADIPALGANPTATIGASAVNGSAATYMRSDAAPALPATLPALSGVNLTALNATNLGSGTVANARLTGAYTGITGLGTIAGLTVTGSLTATGLVTNADLVNQSATVNGQTCTLGSSCTVTAEAAAVTVGTTTIGGGTTTRVLYDNAGVLGEYSITGTGNAVMSASPTGTGTWALPILQATTGAFGGATIGSNVFAATGTGFISSTFNTIGTQYIGGDQAATNSNYISINSSTISTVHNGSGSTTGLYFSLGGNSPGVVFMGTVAGGSEVHLKAAGSYAWSGNSSADNTADTFISRASAGAVSIDTTTAGNALGTLNAATFNISGSATAGNLVTSNNRLSLTGSRSQSAWTTNGSAITQAAVNYTDTTSSGTVAAVYVNAFKAPSLLASSVTTFTNAYGTYFEDPICSTNVTCTNKWALGADSLQVTGSGSSALNLSLGGIQANLSIKTANGDIQSSSGGGIQWNGRTVLKAPSDGVLSIANNGNTNSFTITAGASSLATFNGGVTANRLTSTNDLTVDGTSCYTFVSRAKICSSDTNTINIKNNSNADGGLTTAGITATGTVTGNTFVPTSSTAPTNGMYLSAANTLAFAINSNQKVLIDVNGLYLPSGGGASLFDRNATATVASVVNNRADGTAGIGGTSGTVSVITTGNVENTRFVAKYAQIVGSYIVSGLPSCVAGLRGARTIVTDLLTPAFLVAVVGGGAVTGPALCDGTNWVAD